MQAFFPVLISQLFYFHQYLFPKMQQVSFQQPFYYCGSSSPTVINFHQVILTLINFPFHKINQQIFSISYGNQMKPIKRFNKSVSNYVINLVK